MRLGFLCSGRGSNLQAILDACANGTLAAIPSLVISNNANAPALARAAKIGIPALHISAETVPRATMLDKAIADALRAHHAELVVLAGYLKPVGSITLNAFLRRVINVHPSLLPKYGGRGMYGKRVHQAVLRDNARETGATIHLVDSQYDTGRILAQQKILVHEKDTATSLSERLLPVEHALYIRVLQSIINHKLNLDDPNAMLAT